MNMKIPFIHYRLYAKRLLAYMFAYAHYRINPNKSTRVNALASAGRALKTGVDPDSLAKIRDFIIHPYPNGR